MPTKRYRARNEGMDPLVAEIGGQQFTFDKRPSADVTIDAMMILADRETLRALFRVDVDADNPELDDDALSAMDKIKEVMGTVREVFATSLADDHDVADLMTAVDMPVMLEVLSDVLAGMTDRPTTGSPDSSDSAPPTTSTTGGSEPASTQTPVTSSA